MSEITIALGESKIYLRLVLVLYSLSFGLIICSSMYFLIKWILLIFIVVLFRVDWANRRPCSGIKIIQFIDNKWVLGMGDSRKESYIEANVLINNPLFHLIQLTNLKQKKLFLLFDDQVTKDELRFLYLKIGNY